MTAMPQGLRFEAVDYRQDDFRLTADFTFLAGMTTAIIGPSGAGKSTLLDLIAGFVAPQGGRLLWEGRDLTPLPPSERPVTLVFQEHNLFGHLTAAQNVGLGLRPDLRLDAAGWDRVADALAAVGLRDMGPRRPAALSGGERSRVALARALLRHRPLLLLDEPFAALDPAMRADMADLLNGLRDETNSTMLFITHQEEDIRRLADRVMFLEAGKILLEEKVEDFLARRDPPAVAKFLDRSGS